MQTLSQESDWVNHEHAQQQKHPPQARSRGNAHAPVKQAFEQSSPWQYRLPNDSRQWRHVCKRRHRLAIYLAGYPSCYPGLPRIAREMGWGRATVARLMADLRTLKVMKPMGYVSERGTRIRVLDPNALTLRREDETPARVEDEALELPEKNHKTQVLTKDEIPPTESAIDDDYALVDRIVRRCEDKYDLDLRLAGLTDHHLEIMIEIVDGRGKAEIVNPAAYFAKAIEKMLQSEESMFTVEERYQQRRDLRQRYMPNFEWRNPRLTEEQEQRRQQFNRKVTAMKLP